MLLFGGEQDDPLLSDSKATYILNKVSDSSFDSVRSSDLPQGATPAFSSYAVNNTLAYYFISTEAAVFRLNKQEMTWTKWS